MSLPESTEILIVGAGPTGLCLALSLHKQGFTDFVVVDSLLPGDNGSRALAVHAATVEVRKPPLYMGCSAQHLPQNSRNGHVQRSFFGSTQTSVGAHAMVYRHSRRSTVPRRSSKRAESYARPSSGQKAMSSRPRPLALWGDTPSTHS